MDDAVDQQRLVPRIAEGDVGEDLINRGQCGEVVADTEPGAHEHAAGLSRDRGQDASPTASDMPGEGGDDDLVRAPI